MVTCFECDNDRSKIDDRSLNSPITRFRFGSRFSALILLLLFQGEEAGKLPQIIGILSMLIRERPKALKGQMLKV